MSLDRTVADTMDEKNGYGHPADVEGTSPGLKQDPAAMMDWSPEEEVRAKRKLDWILISLFVALAVPRRVSLSWSAC